MYLKPVLAFLSLLLYYYGLYEDGNFALDDGYAYITAVYMLSYSVAIYALILFYVAAKDLLKSFNPIPKFLMIKAVVFLTYWQVRREGRRGGEGEGEEERRGERGMSDIQRAQLHLRLIGTMNDE